MKIVLLCALGMSTSLLVERMKKSAKERGIAVEIEAHSVDSIDEQLEIADVVLLGPQIRYKKHALFSKAEATNTPIDIVEMKAYGTINGEKVLDQALALKNKL